MPLTALPGGPRPSGVEAKVRSKHAQPSSAKKNGKRVGVNDDDDDDEEETTTDESSDEEDALEMDGQELWTQTYCATCDCLIEPGEGIAKADDGEDSVPLATHSTLKSRSGTIKARPTSTSDRTFQVPENNKVVATKESPAAVKNGPSNLKRTNSAGRLHARAGAGPLGPHKRTGSAGSRLNALSELRPTTKLHDDKGKAKAPGHDSGIGKGRKSPATSRPTSAASNRTHSNSSGPSSYKSNEATIGNHTSSNGSSQRSKGRGFLGGLTPAALKQQEAELAAKRKAPAPLYCSERCRLIDERRSSGLGELTKYLSQPLEAQAPIAWVPQSNVAWGPSPSWPRSTSTSSMPLPAVPSPPESECMCPECMDKLAEAGSTGAATVPSGASDTATESSSGVVYGRGPVSQKPRTASGRLITPHNLHAPGSGTDGYFPPQVTKQGSISSPRVRPTDSAYPMEAVRENVPPRSSSAASGGRSSNAGTDGSAISSESGSSLWEPRLRRMPDSSCKSISSSTTAQRPASSTSSGVLQEASSGLTTSTVTPAISPRHSIIASPLFSSHGTARQSHRLSVPVFASAPRTKESEGPQRSGMSPSSYQSRPLSSSMKAAPSLATSPLNLLQRSSHHHGAPSIDLVSEHVGSPSTRGSLLSRSLASEHTLMGVSGITLHNHRTQDLPNPAINENSSSSSSSGGVVHSAAAQDARTTIRNPIAMRPGDIVSADNENPRSATDEELSSLAMGSLRLAQSRAGGSLANLSRRMTDVHDKNFDGRRLSLFGNITKAERRDSNAQSIASSGSGSTGSGWLRSLSSVWLNWRNPASAAPARGESSDIFASTEDSVEWPNHPILERRRESDASFGSGGQQQKKKQGASFPDPSFGGGELSSSPARVAASSGLLSPRLASRDQAAGITPTQSLVAKPTIRRGSVPAFVREIGQGGIPGDASEGKFDGTPNSLSRGKVLEGPAEHLARARADSLSTATDEERRKRRQEKKEAKHRRSRDIAVLPPLLAPASRSGSSTNLYGHFGPMPRSARTYSNGRAWTVNNTPQMFVGSAGSSNHQPSLGVPGEVPPSPTALRSPYQSSFALAQDAARAAMSPSRPNSAAGYHAGTSPRVKGLGWGAVTSMAPITTNPPASAGPHPIHFAPRHHHPHHVSSHHHQQHQHALQPHGHSQSVSYGHAAALASRHVQAQAQAHHDTSSRHHHSSTHHSQQHHHHHSHQHGHQPHQLTSQHQAAGPVVNLGIPPNAHGQPTLGRHSTMPVTLHRSPTPSVPEDGGEMSSQDLTSGDFISRPNSAMAMQQGRQQRASMMPPPRSRSSLGMHGSSVKPSIPDQDAATSTADFTQYVTQRLPSDEPERKWSYDQLSGLKTYPILQLPDRETHDIYDPAWGLDAGGLAKHMGRPQEAKLREDPTSPKSDASARAEEASANVQKGFQPHRKKLFYFDA